MRWIAIACVTAIVAGALVSGANAWAAKGDERCRRVPAPGPSAENPNGHGSMRAWRGAALRAVGCGLPNDEPSTLNVMLKPWLLVSKTYVYPPDGGGPLFWAVQSVGGVLLLTRSTVLRLASASIRCLLPFTQARMKPLT